MHKLKLRVLLFLFSSLPAMSGYCQTYLWNQKADFGGVARENAVGFSIGSLGYVGTGFISGVGNLQDFWEYNPVSDTWSQKADFGGGMRDGAIGFSIGSKGYVGTGFGATNYMKDFWEYDPSINVWTQKSDFGGAMRTEATGFSVGNKGYVGIGTNYNDSLRDFWEYNPLNDSWTQKADFAGGFRYFAVGFGIGSKGYIGTGVNALPPYQFFKDFWEYDPAVNTWLQKSDVGFTGRIDAIGFSIGSKGYIGSGDVSDFWEYDTGNGMWTQKAFPVNQSWYQAVGFSIGNKGYMGVGHGGLGISQDFYEFSLTTCIANITTIGSTYLCPGNTVTLMADSASSYLWSNGANTRSILVSDSGNYSVSETYINNCVATSSSIHVRVNSLRVTSSSTNVTCGGQHNGTATVIPNGGTPPYFFSWNSSPLQSTQTASNLAPGVYTVTVSDSACSVMSTVFITEPTEFRIDYLPIISPIWCHGDSTGSIRVELYGGTRPYQYIWNAVPPATDSIISNIPAGTYSVTCTDGLGCTVTDSVTIMEPPALIVDAGSDTILCSTGLNTMLLGGRGGSPTATGGKYPYHYLWHPNSGMGIDSTVANPYLPYNSTANTTTQTYIVEVSDGYGCTGVDSILITQYPEHMAPTVTIPQSFCNEDSITLTCSPAFSYQWQLSSIDTNQSVTVLGSSGTIVVYTNDQNGCSAFSVYSLNPLPTPPTPIIQNVSNYLYCSASSGCQWYLNSILIPGATGQTYSPVATGIYNVTFTDTNGCTSDLSQPFYYLYLGLSSEDLSHLFSIYPNPSTGRFDVKLVRLNGKKINLSLSNYIGETILSKQIIISNDEYRETIDISNQSPGLYFIFIEIEGKQHHSKVIFK